ncbi:MAG TPA: hypothetical protein VGF94_18675 [Kofleriaceae bacterium]
MRILGLVLVSVVVGCGHHHEGATDAGSGPADACTDNLACFQYDCSLKNLPPTSVSGTVYAPNGTLPLYGVNVYVPESDPGPLTQGVSCDQCAAGLPGGAFVQTTTDEAGHFELDNMPATTGVPLVIQVGKWRRQLALPAVAACQDSPVDVADTTLPKSRTDLTPNSTGVDLPKIAISTGDADALECLVLKLGIDPKEISSSTGSGQINLFTDKSSPGVGASTFAAGWAGGTDPMTDSATLWGSTTNLSAYDILILSCEGDQYPATKPQAALQAVHDYAGIGGRVFASHWHNIWIGGDDTNAMHGLPDWEAVATFNFGGNPPDDPLHATIDETDNPKGMSFATWMVNVMGSAMRDDVLVSAPRDTCTSVDETKGEQWVFLDTTGASGRHYASTMNFQFTTPQDADPSMRCGKVVFSDMHVSADSTSTPGTPYPGGCSCELVGGAHDPLCTMPKPLTAQEKALAFMFFDIASCVGTIQ